MARHVAVLEDDPITEPLRIIPAATTPARQPWPNGALVMTLVAGLVAVAAATLFTVQLVRPAALATPAASAPIAAGSTSNPPSASASTVPAATTARSSAESSDSSGSEEPLPGSSRIGGPSPTGWTDGNGNPVPDPLAPTCLASNTCSTDPDAASSTDQQFLADLKSRNIVTPGITTELQGAATLCQNLGNGSTLTREANKLMDAPYNYSAALAGYFAGQAVLDYCPRFSDQLR